MADRTWLTFGPVISPELLNWQLELGRVKPAQLESYRVILARLKEIRKKYQGPLQDLRLRQMIEAVDWTLTQWVGKEKIPEPPSGSVSWFTDLASCLRGEVG